MSRLSELINQIRAKDTQLAADLAEELRVLSSRRAFGLNFERHQPEAVQLPQRPIRKGDKVRVLPERGSIKRGDQRLWRVVKIETIDGLRLAHLELRGADTQETQVVVTDDLVVVAEFRDPIYPGLRSTGRVVRGADKPFHTVINAENFHALQTLLYTHRGGVDCIYIDPPYNTGAHDWKYNNDYVDGDDLYRHSKWLAFMERRLKLARELLNPDNSVLIVSIDEKEYLRLGLLLEQTFPDARIQMVSAFMNARSTPRDKEFGRDNEFVYFVMLGDAGPRAVPLGKYWMRDSSKKTIRGTFHWMSFSRTSGGGTRRERPGMFYPLFVKENGEGIVGAGDALPLDMDRRDGPTPPPGCIAVYPLRSGGVEGRWQMSPESARRLIDLGYLRPGKIKDGRCAVYYVRRGEEEKIASGEFKVVGRAKDGSVITEAASDADPAYVPGTVWTTPSHDAGVNGTNLLRALLPDRRFPFPKSLYAVEDALRFFVKAKPDATILDFFAGSGTTAHAVMRLNREDGGRRQCISVTNNEVAADEHKALLAQGLRPGDPEWEQWGICDYITKPRVEAAITGTTPDGESVRGEYRFTNEFPMAEGLEENVEFFTLTYQSPLSVGHNRAFSAVAPLLWMRAGAQGPRIDVLPPQGWDVVDTYGLLVDLDEAAKFVATVSESATVRMAFVVTNDDRRFQMVCAELPDRIEPVRLYESYLTNFEINTGREL